MGGALWCSGIPGAGKTVLTSLVIDHLRALQLREPAGTIGVAWFYFNYMEEQTTDDVVLSLIQQLSRVSAKLSKLFFLLKSSRSNNHPSPWQLIADTITQAFTKVFIVIDALDEWAERHRAAILEVMAYLQLYTANVLFTSRNHVHDIIVQSRRVDLQRVEILASNGDITNYVHARLTEERSLVQIIQDDPSLRDEIVTAIVDSCQGTFLMAKFHIEGLKKMVDASKVMEYLKVLPQTFRGAYDDAMNRLEGDQDNCGVALRALSFLLYARRPLTLLELQHFLAVSLGDTDFHDERILDKDILLSICAGLVVHGDATGIVRLVHSTAQEYFNEIRISKFPGGDLEMGHICLVYISFNAFKHVPNLTDDFLHRCALLDYILNHWHEHVVDHLEALRSPLLSLRMAYRPVYFNYHTNIEKDLHFHGRTALDVVAATGLLLIARWLVAEHVPSRSDAYSTPLITALIHGHEAVAKLLIENGANINTPTSARRTRTPLIVASYYGRTTMVKLLIGNGANVNAQDGRRSTALVVASTEGHDEVVRLLVGNGADIDVQDVWRDTALVVASTCGYVGVVGLLA